MPQTNVFHHIKVSWSERNSAGKMVRGKEVYSSGSHNQKDIVDYIEKVRKFILKKYGDVDEETIHLKEVKPQISTSKKDYWIRIDHVDHKAIKFTKKTYGKISMVCKIELLTDIELYKTEEDNQ